MVLIQTLQIVSGISAGNFDLNISVLADSYYPLSQQSIFSVNVDAHLDFWANFIFAVEAWELSDLA